MCIRFLNKRRKNGIKIFNTKELMQADTTAKEGDLAVVYRSELKSISNGDTIASITFPKTVVFDEAISNDYYGMLRGENEPMIYLDVQLNASSCFIRDMAGVIPEIEYSSADGITYTRTDSNEDTYEIGETTVEDLDEHICNFIQAGGNVFEGLYKYSLVTGNYFKYTDAANNYELYSDKCIYLTTDISNGFVLVTNTIDKEYHTINGNLPYVDAVDYVIYDTTDFNGYVMLAVGSDNQAYIIASPHVGSSILHKKEYTNGILTNTTDISTETIKTYTTIVEHTFTTSYGYELYKLNTSDIVFSLNTVGGVGGIGYKYTSTLPVGNVAYSTSHTLSGLVSDYLYTNAPMQLSTLANDVYKSVFYGKNGVETGTLTDNIDNSFADISAEIYAIIKQAYNNMEPRVLTDNDKTVNRNIQIIPTNSKGQALLDTSTVTNMTSMFDDCSNLKEVPLLDTSKATNTMCMFRRCRSLKEVPLLDTSNVTDMGSMFAYCSNLKEVPALNTSKVTTFNSMFCQCTSLEHVPLLDTSNVIGMFNTFEKCTNLSDESLNNILAMCTNATKITSNKTLKYLSLTSDQATKCTTLSNYSAFTSAGWTTGY